MRNGQLTSESYIDDKFHEEVKNSETIENKPISNLEKYKYDIMGIRENRIQNIAITIDKVLHVLDLLQTDEPPLIRLTEEEVYQNLWGDSSVIKSVLESNFKHFLNNKKIDKNKEIQSRIHQAYSIIITKNKDDNQESFNNSNYFFEGEYEIINRNTDISQEEKIKQKKYFLKNNSYRKKIKSIAKLMKECADINDKLKKDQLISYRPLSDILLLYSMTHIYFKHNPNYLKSTNSENIQILQRDINTHELVTLENQNKESRSNIIFNLQI